MTATKVTAARIALFRDRMRGSLDEAFAIAAAEPGSSPDYTHAQHRLGTLMIEVDCELMKMLAEGADREAAVNGALAATANPLARMRQIYGPGVFVNFTEILNEMTAEKGCAVVHANQIGGTA